MEKDLSKMFKDLKIPKPTKSQDTVVSLRSMYRTIRFDVKELPDIKDWEIGKTYYVGLKLKQVGKEAFSSTQKDENWMSAEFEIHGVMPDMMELFENKNSKRNIAIKTLKEHKK